MSWAERKARMEAHVLAVVEDAVRVCAALRSEARGGLGYFIDADECADQIEEILLPRARWEDPNRQIVNENAEVPP